LNQVANTAVETNKIINTILVEINKLHKILGHYGETHLKVAANTYGIKVFEKLEYCETCAISKSKENKPNKVWTRSINVPGERLYVDILSIKDESFEGSKIWAPIVDDYTDYCWSYFVKNKYHMKTKVVKLFEEL
jgi:hypothetical protein